jgi:NADH:ubiquinone oxidoreductase subunit D
MHHSYVRVGGVYADYDDDVIKMVREWCNQFPS